MPPFFPLNCTTISAYFGDPFELNWIDILHFQILLFSFFFSWNAKFYFFSWNAKFYLFWWQLNNSLHSHLPFPQLQNQLGHLKLKEIDRQISFSWPQIAISSSAHLNRLNIHPYHHFDSFKYPKISFLPSSYLEDTQFFFLALYEEVLFYRSQMAEEFSSVLRRIYLSSYNWTIFLGWHVPITFHT